MPPKKACPHCDRDVSKSTWYSHHHDFFDQSKGEWQKVTSYSQQQRSCFNFSEEESTGSCDDCSDTAEFPFSEGVVDQHDDVSSL